MSIELLYDVHRVSVHPYTKKVISDGEEVDAIVNRLEVELVSHDGHGTLTLSFQGSKLEPAKNMFGRVVDDHILDAEGKVHTERTKLAPIEGPVSITVSVPDAPAIVEGEV